MKTLRTYAVVSLGLALLAVNGCKSPNTTSAGSTGPLAESEQSQEARRALAELIAKTPAAAALSKEAKATLVFPQVVKGGFIIGAQGGAGSLFKGNELAGYYDTVGGSYGLQAGVQKYGYVLFFMTDDALKYVDSARGWEIGVGPSVVVVDQGAAASFTTTTSKSDVYAFVFDQKGLMAGIGLQGNKIVKAR